MKKNEFNHELTRKKRIKKKKIGSKIDLSHITARIDTGLSKRTPIPKRSTSVHVGKKKKVSTLPDLRTLSDLVELGIKIGKGENFARINNIALARAHKHLAELNELVGLDKLKRTVFDQVIYFLQDLDKITNNEYLHTILTGPPGVGKTTVAKILGKIYATMGVIKNPRSVFKIAHREDLVAAYLGQTATKTLDLLKSCIGGVLFIDEVYSLGSGVSGKDSFSKEAVDTLCGFLSENAGKFICIIAGYEKDVDRCFFKLNKGLKSRFQWVHKLEPYTPEQISDIFLSKVEDIGWKTRSSDNNKIRKLIADKKEVFENGQGRAVQNLLFKCKIAHSKRLLYDVDEKAGTINHDDVHNAIDILESDDADDPHSFSAMFI